MILKLFTSSRSSLTMNTSTSAHTGKFLTLETKYRSCFQQPGGKTYFSRVGQCLSLHYSRETVSTCFHFPQILKKDASMLQKQPLKITDSLLICEDVPLRFSCPGTATKEEDSVLRAEGHG